MASSTHSQTSLATVNIARYGPRVVNHDVFTCEGAVDAHRLLSLVRKDICQLARRHGWNALTEEQWECTIFTKPRAGKRARYTVKVCYEAILARSLKSSLECCPAELEAAKGVDGIMTVLRRDAKQKVIDSSSPAINWWERLSQHTFDTLYNTVY
ncbi:hypothetical protein AX14_013656 [Amanita brunnescens Koide BX004]|nr:hypothetical protein AX14_013656 [Amanita brunnescens Koide BX004]